MGISIFKKEHHLLSRYLGLLLISTIISGCQSLGFFQDNNEHLVSQMPSPQMIQSKVESIETHKFQLTGDQSMIGSLAVMNIRENDTFSDIARHFGLGYNDISVANPTISPWTPLAGSRILLPLQYILPNAPHNGIVLNLANKRLFYYPKQQPNNVYTYPVGIGRQGWNTPLGLTSIVAKKANPTWVVPKSIHQEHAEKGDALPSVVAAGPNNPLGLYAMQLGFPRYLIHGTNKPYGIGMQISHGCVQLYPEDIEVLFKHASEGMPVRIIHQPYMTAWDQNMLYLEANEPLQKWELEKHKFKIQLLKQLKAISRKKNVSVDWKKVDDVINKSNGVPTPILANSPEVSSLMTHTIELEHPEQFYKQPTIEDIKDSDWSILIASFNNEIEAQKLAAMLNHQGPIIPSRKVQKNNSFQVISGPFKNKKEVNSIAKRIKMDFEMEVKLLKPIIPMY
jgi:L,D-transpeptidase ErfK/SrfK